MLSSGDKLIFLGLQQFGVISFEIKALMYCHIEQRRTQRFYIAEIVRHRGTVGAWRNRGYLRVFINVFCLWFCLYVGLHLLIFIC